MQAVSPQETPATEPAEHVHTLIHQEAKTPTCVNNGIREHWYCPECNARFSDAEATTEVTFADLEIEENGHTPAKDDGDCTTAVDCTVCGKVAVAAKAHTPAEDDGDCTTAVACTECEKNAVEAKDAHTGGTATCLSGKICTTCGKEYSEEDPDNHADEAFDYVDNGDGSHTKYYAVCGIVANGEEAHSYKYTVNEDGTHTGVCICGLEVTENHSYVDRQCVCGAKDPSAYITGVALTVDGVTYTGAEGEGTVYITPASQITVTIFGENLQNAPKDDHPAVSGFIVWFAAGYGTINEAGTESTIVSSPSEWTHESNSELFLVNVNSSNGDFEFDLDTGIVVTYVTGAGTDLTEIYFNNANAWETITATFYTAEDNDGDRHQLGTAELSLVGGESVIYSTTNIPKNAAYVTFSNGTETTDIIEIPMAADGTNQYNMDGIWTTFKATE